MVLAPVVAVALLGLGAHGLRAESPAPRQQARYSMGTMFEVTAYHADGVAADRAMDAALREVARLDRILSHYKPESDLSRLNREGAEGFVAVDPSLREVVEQAIAIARQSGGRFDPTIAPLLELWQTAFNEGRVPSPDERERAGRCVGYQNVEILPPDRIRFRSACTELNLGGIGKGYAVERALRILAEHGVRHALVNAGGSTIGAIGRPPGAQGWPVRLQAPLDGHEVLLLRDTSISTSRQQLAPLAFASGSFGEIIDPAMRAPARDTVAVSVVSPSATASDALATALLLMEVEDGRRLLDRFAGASALWMHAGGTLQATHGASALRTSGP